MKKISSVCLLLTYFFTTPVYSIVGLLGKDGQATVLFQSDESIIIKECSPYSLTSGERDDITRDCQGEEHPVPQESLMAVLKELMTQDSGSEKNPLSPSEIKAYQENRSLIAELEVKREEFEKIEKTFETFGEAYVDLERRKTLQDFLTQHNALKVMTLKINNEIKDLVQKIINKESLHFFGHDKPQDQFTYKLLSNVRPWEKMACGFGGTIDERLQACSATKQFESENLALIGRRENGLELYLDLKNNLIWSSRLPYQVIYDKTEESCQEYLSEFKVVEDSAWRIPSEDQYQDSFKVGVRHLTKGYFFWTSTIHGVQDYGKRYKLMTILNGGNGETRYYGGVNEFRIASVNCIAKIKDLD